MSTALVSQPPSEDINILGLDHPRTVPKFSAPAHPSLQLLQKIRADAEAASTPGSSSSSQTRSDGNDDDERDPHEQPTFTQESFAHPSQPILYLPPLISSLPKQVSANNGSASTTIEVTPTNTSEDSERPLVLTTETRLPDIDPVSLSLHRALHHFRPLNTEYARTPYADAFNWDELRLPEEEEREWYCVAFRSRRKEGSNGDALYEADKKAHEEAVQNGGLLMYWYGVPDPSTGLNLATCIWQSRAHAAAANARPHHIRAMRLAKDAYAVYALERHVLRKRRGEVGVRVEKYEGGDVGW